MQSAIKANALDSDKRRLLPPLTCTGREPLRRCPADELGTLAVCVYVAVDLAPYAHGDDESATARAALMHLDPLLAAGGQVSGAASDRIRSGPTARRTCSRRTCSSSAPERSAAFSGCRQHRRSVTRCSCGLGAGTRAVIRRRHADGHGMSAKFLKADVSSGDLLAREHGAY